MELGARSGGQGPAGPSAAVTERSVSHDREASWLVRPRPSISWWLGALEHGVTRLLLIAGLDGTKTPGGSGRLTSPTRAGPSRSQSWGGQGRGDVLQQPQFSIT